MGKFSPCFLLFVIFTTSNIVYGLDENSVKEKKCFEPDLSSVDLDYGWVWRDTNIFVHIFISCMLHVLFVQILLINMHGNKRTIV